MARFFTKIIFLIIIATISGSNGRAADRVPVFVSILPQKYFVQQIGKDRVDVHVMVQPGANPATYEPKPKQMADLSRSRLYFAIGVPFENAWLEKIAAANPEMTVIHTEQGISRIPMTSPHSHEETGGHAGPDESRGRGILDPHIWLSPPLVKIQARSMLAALEAIDPSNRAFYAANHARFVSAIDGLDGRLRAAFAGRTGLRFMVFHPAWGYFAQAYGLQQVPIEIEGKDPKPAQLRELIDHARQAGIQVIFVQPQFSTRSADIVAREIGAQVAFADPLAEDWLANLEEVAVKFKATLK